VTGRDWLTADEAALDSYATARRLSRLGDDRYDTAADALFDEDAEPWEPDPGAAAGSVSLRAAAPRDQR
jgi:hypothetical protein